MAGKKWDLSRLQSESSYWRSSILITAAHLDLFSWIGNGKKNSAALAAYFGGDAVDWEVYLNALVSMGLLRKRGEQYANTAFTARYLRSGRTTVLPHYDAWNSWGRLASALTTGKRPRTQEPFVSDRAKAERLLQGLDLHAKEIAPHLIKQLRFSSSRTLLDVGGGFGTYSQAFCRRYPRLRVTLVEHPKILSLARRAVRNAKMMQRVRVVGLDFTRESLPRGFDSVFASNILHAHGVRENRAL